MVGISSGFHRHYKITMNICFIGGGNMAGALLGGLLQQGYSPGQIAVVEINARQRDRIKREFNVEATEKLDKGVGVAKSGETDASVIVLAIKPQQLSLVARELAPLLCGQLVISIAAGIRATDISRWM